LKVVPSSRATDSLNTLFAPSSACFMFLAGPAC
jgi:hypothetical protein